jgi:uncharacterized protein (DUF3084 family)
LQAVAVELEQVKAEIAAVNAEKAKLNAEIAELQASVASPEPEAEPIAVAEEAPVEESAEQKQPDLDARASELANAYTIAQLRDMASALGLSISGRAKEASIAKEIAIKEQENGSNDGQ